jgi:serine/threonine-protein kinase
MRFGIWRAEQLVAQGAQTEIHRARAEGHGVVAIKTVRADRDGAESRARLRLEHALLAQLAHPHIVRPLGGGDGPRGRPWFAMAWLSGEEFLPWLSRATLDRRERGLLFDVINHAVAYLHHRGIVHGDLVSGNVLIDPSSMHLTLIDFDHALPIDWLLPEARARHRVADGDAPMSALMPTAFAPDVRALGLMLRDVLGVHATPADREIIADCLGDDASARPFDAQVLRGRLLALEGRRAR